MEVGAKHPHDSVVREFRGLIIVLQASSGHAKGVNPRSYFLFTKITGALNKSIR
jgi:hypothetical protein